MNDPNTLGVTEGKEEGEDDDNDEDVDELDNDVTMHIKWRVLIKGGHSP